MVIIIWGYLIQEMAPSVIPFMITNTTFRMGTHTIIPLSIQ